MNLGAETEELEFKKSTGELKEGIISLGSMLNKNGNGTIYFGVKNNGEIIGQQIGDRTLRDISQAVAAQIRPQIIPTITLELLDEKNVVKVVAQGADAPYSAYGKYYIRSADEDRELSPEQLRTLMIKKSEIDLISKRANVSQNLAFQTLKTLYTTRGLTVNNAAFEDNLGLKMENGAYNILAGILADENDISIKIAAFRGQDKSELIRRNEYGYKCLLLAMDQVLSYMESLDETEVELNPHGREETQLFDMECFREAWINACLHTKWERMNPPAVYLYQDRIEIISTGGLPEDLTKEEFFRGISRPVNVGLQKIFGQLGFVEQTGHGIPLIVSRYGEQAFDIMDNYVNVTLPLNRSLLFAENVSEFDEITLNASQQKIYNLLKKHSDYTIKDLTKATKLSDSYVRKVLGELRAKKIVERVGSNKTGYWKVNGR